MDFRFGGEKAENRLLVPPPKKRKEKTNFGFAGRSKKPTSVPKRKKGEKNCFGCRKAKKINVQGSIKKKKNMIYSFESQNQKLLFHVILLIDNKIE